jgi:endo-1,4-beta-xylanase
MNTFIPASALFASMLLSAAAAGDEIPLWPSGAPGSEGKTGEEAVRVTDAGEHVVSNIHNPSLTPFLPPTGQGNGAAVIVIPVARTASCGWITRATTSRAG